MPVLIVDAYNIINNWKELKSLKLESLGASRDQLIEMLGDLAPLYWSKIYLVFDAYQVKGQAEKREDTKDIVVIYTKEGETADTMIKRLTSCLVQVELVEVATSDWTEQQAVMLKGAARISARELRERVFEYKKVTRDSLAKRGLLSPRESLDARLATDVRNKLEKLRRQK